MDSQESPTSSYEKDLIEHLRDEAREVKDCYTKYSYYAIMLTVAIVGIALEREVDATVYAILSTIIILLILTTSRIGVHKYGTANRINGFELHLFRLKRLSSVIGKERYELLRWIGWEEAMRAWRVVHVSIYSQLYHTGGVFAGMIKGKIWWWWKTRRSGKSRGLYRWYDPEHLVKKVPGKSVYYSGNYLRNLNSVLYLLCAPVLAPLLMKYVDLAGSKKTISLGGWGEAPKEVIILAVLILLTVIVGYRFFTDRWRRKSLETGLLAIHSSAIVWHSVVEAHFRTLNTLADIGYENHEHYTEILSLYADDLTSDLDRIHEWAMNWTAIPKTVECYAKEVNPAYKSVDSQSDR